jgi:hypothetical protein
MVQNIEKELIIAILYLVKHIPDDFPFERIIGSVEEIFANESYLALESICSNIDDFDIPITKEDYTRISTIINIVKTHLSDELANEYSEYLELIKEHVVPS